MMFLLFQKRERSTFTIRLFPSTSLTSACTSHLRQLMDLIINQVIQVCKYKTVSKRKDRFPV